jgi:hypothetical protein
VNDFIHVELKEIESAEHATKYSILVGGCPIGECLHTREIYLCITLYNSHIGISILTAVLQEVKEKIPAAKSVKFEHD